MPASSSIASEYSPTLVAMAMRMCAPLRCSPRRRHILRTLSSLLAFRRVPSCDAFGCRRCVLEVAPDVAASRGSLHERIAGESAREPLIHGARSGRRRHARPSRLLNSFLTCVQLILRLRCCHMQHVPPDAMRRYDIEHSDNNRGCARHPEITTIRVSSTPARVPDLPHRSSTPAFARTSCCPADSNRMMHPAGQCHRGSRFLRGCN
jgi:hypothetical protein